MASFGNYGFGQRPLSINPPTYLPKPKVFVSYHHELDQGYYDRFTLLFSTKYDILTDTSIERRIDSDSADYQQQVIRERHITGSSITVVLCGSETWKRRWIDWEIHMTLNKQHALLGIALPTAVKGDCGGIIVPDRLHANIQTGYAHWIGWTEDPTALRTAIEIAKEKARWTSNIDNSAPRMKRSRP